MIFRLWKNFKICHGNKNILHLCRQFMNICNKNMNPKPYFASLIFKKEYDLFALLWYL